MNFKHVMIVFKKEMKDSFRDRKSVLTNILLPLVLIPLVYFFMNMAMQGATKDIEENMKITVISQDIEKAEEFTKQNIIGEDNIEIIRQDEQTAQEELMEGNIHCVLLFQNDFFEKLEQGQISNIELKYNSLKNASALGMQKMQTKILGLNQMLASQTLVQMNLSPEILNLVSAEVKDASLDENNGKQSNEFLMMIIPMYLVIIIVTAGVPLAIDVIAGERERNTFEALLSTKANRLSILVGKYLAILVFSIIAIVMSFIGLVLGILMNPEMFTQGDEVMSLTTLLETMNMPVGAMLFVLLSAITLAVVFAGIQMAISTISKSVKEAQTYLSYMTFPAMILGFATMFMGAGDMQNYMAFIPIFNTIASLKMVLGGVIDYGFLLTGVIVNIVVIVIVTIFIAKLFKNEKVIIK